MLRPGSLISAKRSFKLTQQSLVFGSILFQQLLLRYPLRQERIFRTNSEAEFLLKLQSKRFYAVVHTARLSSLE